MAAFYIFAGLMHFLHPEYYVVMIPPLLPAPLALVYISGVAELAGGLGVLYSKTRRAAAWGLILLLIAVFPANLYVAIENIPVFGASQGPGIFGWIRLPLQIVLIYWAWVFTR